MVLVGLFHIVFSAIVITQKVMRKTTFTTNVFPWVHITEQSEWYSGEKV